MNRERILRRRLRHAIAKIRSPGALDRRVLRHPKRNRTTIEWRQVARRRRHIHGRQVDRRRRCCGCDTRRHWLSLRLRLLFGVRGALAQGCKLLRLAVLTPP